MAAKGITTELKDELFRVLSDPNCIVQDFTYRVMRDSVEVTTMGSTMREYVPVGPSRLDLNISIVIPERRPMNKAEDKAEGIADGLAMVKRMFSL